MKKFLLLLLSIVCLSCENVEKGEHVGIENKPKDEVFKSVVVRKTTTLFRGNQSHLYYLKDHTIFSVSGPRHRLGDKVIFLETGDSVFYKKYKTGEMSDLLNVKLKGIDF